mmetsp:Transcript_31067/g.107373  ORF Transcript_31067/g.107373 Transcript_31067/m.107373 type:complete len:96 (+) Transcript_31067:123-410(+)
MVHGLAAQEVLQGAGAGGNPGWPAAAPPPSEEPSPPKWAPRTRGRSRRELPERAVYILKAWLTSAEHFKHPYPSSAEQARLLQATGIDKKQLKCV